MDDSARNYSCGVVDRERGEPEIDPDPDHFDAYRVVGPCTEAILRAQSYYVLADLEKCDCSICRRTVVVIYVLTKFPGPIILRNEMIGILRHRSAVEGYRLIRSNRQCMNKGHDNGLLLII